MISKMKILIKNGFGHIFGANIINQLISFISGFILIRVLSKSDYGVYSYAFNIYSFFALFTGLGIESACIQLCSEERKDEIKTNGYMKFSILYSSAFNILLGGIIVLVAFCVPFSIKGAGIVLAMFALTPLLTNWFNLIQAYYRYSLMNQKYAINSVINSILILGGSIIGAILFRTQGLIVFRTFAFVISIILAILAYQFPIKEIIFAIKIKIAEIKDMMKISFVSMLNIATGQLLYLVDVFLIGIVLSDELTVATYKTATIIPNALLFIPSSLMVYVYPYFAEKKDDKKWVREKFLTILKYFSMVNAMITVLLIIIAPIIVKIVFGEQYLDAVPTFRILLLSYFFSASFRKVTGNLLVTQRKLNVNFWIGIMEGVINIVGNWILIHQFGAIGAAYTTLIICVVSSIISTVYFLKYLKNEK